MVVVISEAIYQEGVRDIQHGDTKLVTIAHDSHCKFSKERGA